MIALDTNLLIRMIIVDAAPQTAMVKSLIFNNTVFVPKTVLLESEWVLRSRYGVDREVIADFFMDILLANNTMIEDFEGLQRAVAWYRLGADFADALHLVSSGDALLHTFDHEFCKRAIAQGIAPEVKVLESD